MENFNMADQLGTATLIAQKKNIEEKQEEANMEFSSTIQDVMSAPIDSAPMSSMQNEQMMMPQMVAAGAVASSDKKSSGYPFNLSKAQVEALVAGVAAVAGVSGPIQDKLAEMIPNFFNDLGKLSMTGMGVTVLVVAIIFYFLRQMVVKSNR